MSSNRDPQALQDLWGLQDGGNEDDDYEEDEDDDEDNVAANSKFRSERAEQNERIKGMRAGTGKNLSHHLLLSFIISCFKLSHFLSSSCLIVSCPVTYSPVIISSHPFDISCLISID
jgi:hypothetical protein